MKVGIIGSGLQCVRRIESIRMSDEDSVSLVVGINPETLSRISKTYQVEVSEKTEEIFERQDIDAIIICTPPNSHFEYMRKALFCGKKVLVEKPISKSSNEIEQLMEEFGDQVSKNIFCGFNHRFHPGIAMAKDYIENEKIGKIIFARAIYGISARPEYTKEWRSDPAFAAGGQFIEQGSHQIDLLQWMLGNATKIFCRTTNSIFQNQPLDDGGMAILTFANGTIAQLHTTLGQWHNKFEFEVYGIDGFVRVHGLGNTYGTETCEIGMREDFVPFNSQIYQFRGADKSWILEWKEFKKAIKGDSSKIGKLVDAYSVMRVAEAGYLSEKLRREIEI